MSKKDKLETGALVYGGIPRANLMPPEVAIRRKEAARRRSLVALATFVTVVVVGGVVASFFAASAAEQRLVAERAITDELLATQLEFAEVTQVRADLQTIVDLRSQLASVEVLWRDALAPYLAAVSGGGLVTSITVRGEEPAQPAIGITGPLRQSRVATVSLTVVSPGLPDAPLWFRAWERVDTFADASIDRITLVDGGYTTDLTLNLNATALSQRFAPETEESDDNAEGGEDQ